MLEPLSKIKAAREVKKGSVSVVYLQVSRPGNPASWLKPCSPCHYLPATLKDF